MSSKAKSLRKVFGGTEENRRLQSNVENAVGTLLRHPLLDYRIIKDVELVSGSNSVEHKLGRSPVGYLVIKRSNASTVYDSSMDEKFLALAASADITISILVF